MIFKWMFLWITLTNPQHIYSNWLYFIIQHKKSCFLIQTLNCCSFWKRKELDWYHQGSGSSKKIVYIVSGPLCFFSFIFSYQQSFEISWFSLQPLWPTLQYFIWNKGKLIRTCMTVFWGLLAEWRVHAWRGGGGRQSRPDRSADATAPAPPYTYVRLRV